jgi:uncharacterized membrane protein
MVYWYTVSGWGGFLAMLISMVLWIVLLGLIAWGAYSLFTGRTTNTAVPTSSVTAMELLQQRYARGEIDEPTFTHMRETLQQSRPQAQV